MNTCFLLSRVRNRLKVSPQMLDPSGGSVDQGCCTVALGPASSCFMQGPRFSLETLTSLFS